MNSSRHEHFLCTFFPNPQQAFAAGIDLIDLFAQILLTAHQMEVLKLGNVSLDASKIKANSSKCKALSYEHTCKLEEQIEAKVGELLNKAESADNADIPDGMNIPVELEHREKRLSAIAAHDGSNRAFFTH